MAIIRRITADIAAPVPFTVEGNFIIYSAGLFGGGTAQLQRMNLDGSYVDITSATYTALFNDEITSEGGDRYRIIMTGSTTPTLRIEIPGAVDFV